MPLWNVKFRVKYISNQKTIYTLFLDIDECTENTHGCDTTNADCTDTDGSYTCACKIGWTGDGFTCTSK